MGKITKLIEKNPVLGATPNEIYPVTSTEAVYNRENKSVDDIVEDINTNIKSATMPWFTSDSDLSTLPDGVIVKLGFTADVDKTAKYRIQAFFEYEPGRCILQIGSSRDEFLFDGPKEGLREIDGGGMIGYIDFSKLNGNYSDIPVYINPYCTWDTPMSTFYNFSTRIDSTINNTINSEELVGYNVYSVWTTISDYAKSFIKDIRIFNYNPDNNPFLYLGANVSGNTVTLTFKKINTSVVLFSGSFTKSTTSKIITVPLYGKGDCEGDIIYLTVDSGSENITKLGTHNQIYKANIKDIENTTLVEKALPIKRVVESLHSNFKDLYTNTYNQYSYGVDALDNITDLKYSPLVFYKIFRKVWREYSPETIPYTVLDFHGARLNGPSGSEIIFVDQSDGKAYQTKPEIPTTGINIIKFTGPKGTFYIEVDCTALAKATKNGYLQGNYEVEFSSLPTIKNEKIYDKVEELTLRNDLPVPCSDFSDRVPKLPQQDEILIGILGGKNTISGSVSPIPDEFSKHLPPGMNSYRWDYWLYKYLGSEGVIYDRLDALINTESNWEKRVSTTDPSKDTFITYSGELAISLDTSKHNRLNLIYSTETTQDADFEVVVEGGNGILTASEDRSTWTEANGYTVHQTQIDDPGAAPLSNDPLSSPTVLLGKHKRLWFRVNSSYVNTGTLNIVIRKVNQDSSPLRIWGTERYFNRAILFAIIPYFGSDVEEHISGGTLSSLPNKHLDYLITDLWVPRSTYSTYSTDSPIYYRYSENTSLINMAGLYISKSKVGCPSLGIIPQYESYFINSDNAPEIDGDATYCQRHRNNYKILKQSGNVSFIDLTDVFIGEIRNRRYQLFEALNGKLLTARGLTDEGAKIWAKYIIGALTFSDKLVD